jgi:hypothetical protein
MPDFERVLDDLSLYMAKTPINKARAEGFIAGKNYARKEIAVVMLGVFLLVVVFCVFVQYLGA